MNRPNQTIEELLSGINPATAASEKTAAATDPGPEGLTELSSNLRASLQEHTATKTASATGQNPMDVMSAQIQSMTDADQFASVKEAHLYGAACADGFMARLNMYAGYADKLANAKNDATEHVMSAADAAWDHMGSALKPQKQETSLFDQAAAFAGIRNNSDGGAGYRARVHGGDAPELPPVADAAPAPAAPNVHRLQNPADEAAQYQARTNALLAGMNNDPSVIGMTPGAAMGLGGLGVAGLAGGAYGLSDADTTANKLKNLANAGLGTDFSTQSRVGAMMDKMGSANYGSPDEARIDALEKVAALSLQAFNGAVHDTEILLDYLDRSNG